MATLEDFHANGISFSEVSRPDIDELIDQIPDEGTLHLAILRQPYFDLINNGTKTIESRFNSNRSAPFGKVAVGDLVLLKETGQPVTNYFFASAVHSIDLSQEPIEEVRREFGQGIRATDDYWRARIHSRYATLIKVGERGDLEPLPIIKKDQRGWVTFARN